MDPHRGQKSSPDDWWQPRHSFNIIAGTSTGSILALYFARGHSNISIEARLVLESIWDAHLELRGDDALLGARAQAWITKYNSAQVRFSVAAMPSPPSCSCRSTCSSASTFLKYRERANGVWTIFQNTHAILRGPSVPSRQIAAWAWTTLPGELPVLRLSGYASCMVSSPYMFIRTVLCLE